MLPLILAVVGGYFIGDSMKDKKVFAEGGSVYKGGFSDDDFELIIQQDFKYKNTANRWLEDHPKDSIQYKLAVLLLREKKDIHEILGLTVYPYGNQYESKLIQLIRIGKGSEGEHEGDLRSGNYTISEAEEWAKERLREIFYLHVDARKYQPKYADGGMMADGGVTHEYIEVNGTSYRKDTPKAVIDVLENARMSKRRIKIYYGDVETGRDYHEEYDTTGTVGRSTGLRKAPLLISTSRSTGGGAIGTHFIVKIKDIESGRVLYKNDKYQQPSIEIEESPNGAEFVLMVDGEMYSRHKSKRSADLLKSKLMADGGSVMAKGGGINQGEFYEGQSVIYEITNNSKLDKSVRNLFNKYANKELVIDKIEIDKPYNTAKVFDKNTGEKISFDIILNPRYIKEYVKDLGFPSKSAPAGSMARMAYLMVKGKLGVKIKDFYTETYPTDDLGEQLNDDVTFKDLWNGLHGNKNVYDIMGVGDSVIRERLFEELSEITGVDYKYIYDLWLKSDYADGGMMAKGGRTKGVYYHILEYGNYGNVGHQGYYLTLEEAKDRVKTLEDYFPNSNFQIESSNSKREPVNVTV